MDITVTGVSNSKVGRKGYKENRVLLIKQKHKNWAFKTEEQSQASEIPTN